MKCSFDVLRMCLQELKTALGGRVRHLEAELVKSERAREELRGKKDAEMVQVRYESSKQENHNFKKAPCFLAVMVFLIVAERG